MYVARPLRFIARQINRFRYRFQQRWFPSRPAAPKSDAMTAGAASPSLHLDGSPATGRSLR
jgi:hypothetical protein